MARHKDYDWNLPNPQVGHSYGWETIHSALLMDIRDELRAMNRILNCHNFLNIPHKLDKIVVNTRKKRRARK